MWQVLLAAAVAGSTTLVAKHFLNPNPNQSQPSKCESQENPQDSVISAFDSPVSAYESNYEHREGIFRFSSSGSGSGRKIRDSRKKLGILRRRLKFGEGSDKVEKRSVCLEASRGKRFTVCLKKRRTAKCVPAKCGSSSSKDGSLFGWGLGVGIMYMMSAGKAEISKLSSAMDETSKVVQELRTELYRRKSAQAAACSKNLISDHATPVHSTSSRGDRDLNDIKVCKLPMIDDGECPSSVLTEEPEPEPELEPEVLEVDQLEAELELELQKLPLSATEASGHEVMRPNFGKTEVSLKGFHELEEQNAVSYQCHGVVPSELDQKLCHLLIEQQENQIVELESELNLAQSKLDEKEAELQALKDCVRRLTEFSLSMASDDEAEVQVQAEHECTSEWDSSGNMGSESRKSAVGMKRPIDSA